MVFRSQSKRDASSAWSAANRKRWLDETYSALIEEHGMYVDFRVSIVAMETGEEILQIGGIWHKWRGNYVTGEELADLEADMPVKTVWKLNVPQVKLFSMFPHLLDKEREHPIQELLLRGGRRSGKTEGGVLATLAMGIMYPYAKLAVFGMDFKSNQEMLGKIEALMPQDWYAYYDKALNTLYLRNGTQVTFFSQKNYKRAGRSYSFDMILLDEPTTYDNPQAVLEGCRGAIVQYDGAIIAIYTPPPFRDVMYWEEQKSRSPDPELNESVKTIYFGSTFDNIALSEKAKKKTMLMAKTMGKEEFEREILGKYGRSAGAAIYDFKKELHVIPFVPNHLVDITTQYCAERWNGGEQWEWICGMDFNETPMSFVAYKLYWDPSGGTLVCHKELHGSETNTQKFIYSHIFPWLRNCYPGITSDVELASKVLIVADASAWWQGDNAGRGREAVLGPAQQQLAAAGFKTIQPKSMVRGVNRKKVNTSRFGRNPARKDRLESFRCRIYDRFGAPHVYFLEECKVTIEAIENIPMKDGLPDVKSPYSHGYDSASYPVFNLYPKLQLFTTDVDQLNRTYSIVHELGQKALTESQRQAHPLVQATGKELFI